MSDEALARAARLAGVIEATEDIVAMAEVNGNLEYLNRAGRRLLGLTDEASLAGIAIWELHAAASRERFLDQVLPTAATEGRWRGELTLRAAGGETVPVSEIVIAHHRAGRLSHFSLVARDISPQKDAVRALAHRALHDPLTGLANRALLIDRLTGALGRAARHPGSMAVLFVDLDHFKDVNDRLGHDAGDRVLVAVADRFRGTLRGGDTAGRLGGDEFVLVCEGLVALDGALELAHRVRAAVAEPIEVASSSAPVIITASVGIAGHHGDGEDADAILRRADRALYRAKEGGRDRVETAPPPAPA